MKYCRYPGCGKEINIGKYCTDSCASYHSSELSQTVIQEDEYTFDLNEISEENLEKWT